MKHLALAAVLATLTLSWHKNTEQTMTTYISLESIRRALRNHSTTLIWVNGVIERSA